MKISEENIKLFKRKLKKFRNLSITFPERWSDDYHIKIITVNDDGTFTARLTEIVPAM